MFISLKNVIYELEILFLISSDMLRIGIGSISYMYIFNFLMKQPQGLAIKTLHKKTVVSLLAASIIVTQQGFEPSQQVLSTKNARL